MEGTLGRVHVTDVLQGLRSARESGVLHITREGRAKHVYLENGAVIFASSDFEDERLGEMLVRAGKIQRADLVLACKVREASRLRLGKTLVDMGYLSETEMDAGVKGQVESILRSVIPWKSGRYRAELGKVSVDADLARSDISTENILLESMRDLRDGEAIRRGIGDLDGKLAFARDPSWVGTHLHLTSEEGFVLSRVDGASSAKEIADLSPMGEDETLRCVCALIVASALKVESTESTGPAAPTERLETVKRAVQSPEAERFQRVMLAKHARAHELTYYELLEVEPTASAEEIRAGYFQLAKQLHPDHRAGLKIDDPEGVFDDLYLAVKAGYEVLSNEAERKRYDFSLEKNTPRAVDPIESDELGSQAPAARPPARTFDARQMARLHYANGLRYFDDERYHEAIEELQNAVRLDEGRPEYHRILGRALAKNPKWRRRAEEHLKKVLTLARFDVDTMLELGELYEAGGMGTRARKMYEEALGLDPGNVRALQKLGGRDGSTSFGRLKDMLQGTKSP